MKGFLSFSLVLAIIVCLLWISIANSQNSFTLEQTKNELLKAEIANKERTLLENGFDKIVRIKLTEQVMKRNFNVINAQNEINQKLANYLKQKAYASTIFYEKIGETTTDFLNQNSSVQILQGEGIIYAEYSFTSSFLKNTTVGKKLGNKIITYFEVPIGYTYKGIWPTP
ncbi:MAG: hypothetical protein WCI04_05475 [archaeon]